MTQTEIESYLIETAKLTSTDRYVYFFEDGTGFYGTPFEFSFYAERRLSVFPNDDYEIMYEDVNSLGGKGFHILSS
jgi:hypothetical protein